ncbi:5-dehydro-4-deoxyglucarate dehydratase [Microbacterium pseudoresistens]|uniref:5-dehydro-4-deoxyglucarate dehydratase n=1 Tax=Microbacterium pseudoresistens TaxID=640634 RepID=A0A7Y9ET81_9MICO|nr:5-dehydro-4-deoxyglucarate dehydratase [Microbacterium pseudoresistens]NYD53341.1 5-dehydro-4-deoxyglucarate dehydratase [Microbacterium pseudoresistens]
MTISDAPLFFPVTPFDADGALAEDALHAHVLSRLSWDPGAVVVAGGAGEFHALTQDEAARVVRVAVTATSGAVPVWTGTGGPVGHAVEVARAAEEAGCDALLLLPPYLVEPAQEGLVAYVEAIAAATLLPIVLYHRGTGALTADSVRRLLRLDRIIGIKDGVGDLALVEQFIGLAQEAGRDMLFFNGLPTAETRQAAYERLGVHRYSSAVFTMAPEIAGGFRRPRSPRMRERLLREFFDPLVALRDETPGHAVSLVKAGLRLRGDAVGSVRPPLVDPSPRQLGRLEELLAHGTTIVKEEDR